MVRAFIKGVLVAAAIGALYLGAGAAKADTVWSTAPNAGNPTATCPGTPTANCVAAAGTTQNQGLTANGAFLGGSNLTTQYANQFTFMDNTNSQAITAGAFFENTGITQTSGTKSADDANNLTTALQAGSLQVYAGTGYGLGVTSQSICGTGCQTISGAHAPNPTITAPQYNCSTAWRPAIQTTITPSST